MSEENIEVQDILAHRKASSSKSTEYRILWKGYPVSQATWEVAGNLTGCMDLLDSYHKRNPGLPHPFKKNFSSLNLDDDEQEYKVQNIHEEEKQFWDPRKSKVRGKGRGIGRGPGRPPKNQVGKIWQGPIFNTNKTTEKVVTHSPPLKNIPYPNDGFNVRKNGPQTVEVQKSPSQIVVRQIFAHPKTNEIFYEVEERGHIQIKPRKWVLAKSKPALILFYLSLIKEKNQDNQHVK